MKVEHQIATHAADQSPHQRYARLHRAVENGMASDEVRGELVRICVQLGHYGEAIRHFRQLETAAARQSIGYFLTKQGLLKEPATPPSSSRRPAVADHPGSATDHLKDGFGFLFQDQMPMTVIFATATFPLVAGLGGVLTAGSPGWLLPAIALIPGLCVLAVVGAVARRGMVEASRGLHDAPDIPGVRTLWREATRFYRDSIALILALLGPGAAALAVSQGLFGATGIPQVHGLEGLAISVALLTLGALALPMALLLKGLEKGWRSLNPLRLAGAMWRTKSQYPAIAVLSAVIFAPAAMVFWSTLGHAPWLQVSVVGPLLVVPALMVTRMLGAFADGQRVQLAPVITVRRTRSVSEGALTVKDALAQRELAQREVEKARRAASPQPAAQAQARSRVQRTAGERMASKLEAERGARKAPAAEQRRPAAQTRPAQKRPARTAATRPASTRAGGSATSSTHGGIRKAVRQGVHQAAAKAADHPAPGSGPQANAGSSSKHKVTVDVIGGPHGTANVQDMGPDLSNIPGATVVRGEDRARLGATPRR